LSSIHFYSPWREEKSNRWMKRSILISLRWLPLRLQNDLFIRSKRPMPFGEVYNIIIHNISIIRYTYFIPCENAYKSQAGIFLPTRSYFWNHVKYARCFLLLLEVQVSRCYFEFYWRFQTQSRPFTIVSR